MKEQRSQYQKDKQDELISTNIDSDLIPIAESPEDIASEMREKRCRHQMERIRRCEEEIHNIKILLLGDLESEGSVLRNEVAIEEVKLTVDKILELMEHFDDMLINGLKSQNSKHLKSVQELTRKFEVLEQNLATQIDAYHPSNTNKLKRRLSRFDKLLRKTIS